MACAALSVILPRGLSLVAIVVVTMVIAGPAPTDAAGPAAPGACGPARACPSGEFCAPAGHCVAAAVAVVAGARHSCALHRDGRVSCWGWADAVKGQGGAVSPPVTQPELAHPVALAAGHDETCAVLAGGQVRCVGNDDLALAHPDGRPVTNATAVALGAGFGCALTAEGTLCWGRNESGQLARPRAVAGSPNAILALPGAAKLLGAGLAAISIRAGPNRAGEICGWGNNATHVVPASGAAVVTEPSCGPGADAVELAVGAAHACVRHARGTFSCWGERYYGQLGTGGGKDKADVAAPGRIVTLPALALQIAAGAGHTCVLVKGGQIYCFGLNSAGQVGEGPDQILRPRLRTGLHGRVIAIGAGSAARHTCAVIADGSVECWGNDDAGQLGAATTLQEGRFSRQPVRVGF
jgi:alpha-tubulin suppressor-like RCC1 family protein